MNVVLQPRTNRRYPGTVYADIRSVAGELLVSATYDYCMTAVATRGYLIANAQDVKQWLDKNLAAVEAARPLSQRRQTILSPMGYAAA